MTALDPYPTDLASLDEALPADPGVAAGQIVRALNRLAQAIEQNTLAILDQPAQNAPRAALATLPPVQAAPAMQRPLQDVCPIHGTPWKVVPAGISKKTGNAYEAFRACSTQGCDQRPPR